MLHLNRKAVVLMAVVALVFAALVAPTAAPAKGKVSFSLTGKLHLKGGPSSAGGPLTGQVNGKVGSTTVTGAEVTGAVSPPKLNATFHLKGGSLIIKSTNGTVKKGAVHGSYSVTGTGKYKNAKGSGSFSAPVINFKYTFTGSFTS